MDTGWCSCATRPQAKATAPRIFWISHRKDRRDDFGWEVPQNLGPLVNSSAQENGPAWFDDEANGRTLLYFTSGRAGTLDIYLSEAVGDEKGNFGAPSPVVELNTPYTDYQPVLRKDGLEIFFASSRPGSMTYTAPNGTIYRYPDLWTSTRANTLDPWSPPVNLGPVVNSDQFDFHPTLSWDGTTLIFASERLGPSAGWADLFVSTRVKLVGPQ